ncbi:hypothetical protein [Paenisporosarcina sp. TG20]|uniref:hypothetical protein n=1 Tax=Paenisporosarcina sp. TG20 TaxID=1211706 RepID=UPI0002FDF894|nr:hypothetical protein [Paenisporosarcina sp. TG20]
MSIKKWVLFWMIICLMVVISLIYYNRNVVQQVTFYNQVDFNTVNSSDSWEVFREKLKITKQNSKIENFKLIIDDNKNIHSVKFDVIDKVNSTFEIYHYQNCFSCEFEEENQVQIHINKSDEWKQYDKLINASDFFLKLDLLKQENFFENRKYEYILIHSKGWNEGIGLEGDYFILENESLNKIDKTEQTNYKGFSLSVMGNNLPSNFNSDKKTDTVFISNFTIERLD